MMFEDLDKFIAENPEEVLVTGGLNCPLCQGHFELV